jgi:septal ring factor EnvC (AmiA/AmiB activator)
MFPVQNKGNTAWSERLAAVGDPERLTYHAGWAITVRYNEHMSSMF